MSGIRGRFGPAHELDLMPKGWFSVTLKPDFTVRDSTDTVRIVGDAKWKKETPDNSDFYQMVAYQLAHDAPGLLVYPEQGASITAESYFPDGRRLDLVELPTASDQKFGTFETDMADAMEAAIEEVLR